MLCLQIPFGSLDGLIPNARTERLAALLAFDDMCKCRQRYLFHSSAKPPQLAQSYVLMMWDRRRHRGGSLQRSSRTALRAP